MKDTEKKNIYNINGVDEKMIEKKEIQLLEDKLLEAYRSQVDYLLNNLEGEARACIYNGQMRLYNGYFFERSKGVVSIKLVNINVDSRGIIDDIDSSKGIFLNRALFYSGLRKNIGHWKEIYDALSYDAQGD